MKILFGNLFLLSLLLLSGCSVADPDVPDADSYEKAKEPVVTITGITEITSRRATVHFQIEDTGGKHLEKMFLCYNTQNEVPDTTDYYVISQLNGMNDSIRLSGLMPETKYSISIYAANRDTGRFSTVHTIRTKITPSKKPWKRILPYPGSAKNGGKIVFSVGGKGYIGMGCTNREDYNSDDPDKYYADLWSYDPIMDIWTKKKDFPGKARQNAMTMVIDNKVYLIGGHYFDEEADRKPVFLDDVWMYDPETDIWKERKKFPFGGLCEALTFVIRGKGYMQGGTGWEDDYPDMWEYDPQADSWSRKADIPSIGYFQSAGSTYNNKAYVMCGYVGYIGPAPDCWSYDPSIDKWERLNDFPMEGRVGASAFTIGDNIYLLAGTSGSIENFWIYKPDQNRWISTEQDIKVNIYPLPVFVLGDNAYIQTASNDMYCYDPTLEEFAK